MGSAPSTALPARTALNPPQQQQQSARRDAKTALLHASSEQSLAKGRIARFALGKACLLSKKLKPSSVFLHHAFVLLEVVWDDNEQPTSTCASSSSSSDPPASAGQDNAQRPPPTEYWRFEFSWSSKVFLTPLPAIPDGFDWKWFVAPCTRLMGDLPVRNGWFDARYNNSQHFAHRVMSWLKHTKRHMPPHWFAFWKIGSSRGGDLPLRDAGEAKTGAGNSAIKGDTRTARDHNSAASPAKAETAESAEQVLAYEPPAATVALAPESRFQPTSVPASAPPTVLRPSMGVCEADVGVGPAAHLAVAMPDVPVSAASMPVLQAHVLAQPVACGVASAALGIGVAASNTVAC